MGLPSVGGTLTSGLLASGFLLAYFVGRDDGNEEKWPVFDGKEFHSALSGPNGVWTGLDKYRH